MGQRPADARAALLSAAVAHLAEHGLGGATLRSIATAIGTSHRMLIYHFGSRDGLLLAVVHALEEEQRRAMAELAAAEGTSTGELIRRMWRRVADPRLHPHERLVFELYGRALQGDATVAPLLTSVVSSWVDHLAAVLTARGMTAQRARRLARLGLATTRGLLLDLLATGERAAADEALELFIAAHAPDSAAAEGEEPGDPT